MLGAELNVQGALARIPLTASRATGLAKHLHNIAIHTCT